MEKKQLLSLSATALGTAIRAGETTAVEAMEAVLEQIEAWEGTYHCYVTIERESALAKAAAVQEKIEAGELAGPLALFPPRRF